MKSFLADAMQPCAGLGRWNNYYRNNLGFVRRLETLAMLDWEYSAGPTNITTQQNHRTYMYVPEERLGN